MLLVVDASILVGEALRIRGRELLSQPELELVVAEEAWDETRHELNVRTRSLAQRGILDVSQASELLLAAYEVIESRVQIIPTRIYESSLEDATQRVPQDRRDASTVAVAMVLECGIWTGDRDFFGCGLPVWTTETLQLYLRSMTRD